jgi:hypothetical protein
MPELYVVPHLDRIRTAGVIVPVIVEMRLRADRQFEPTTRQLHGLARALFEGTESNGHVDQDKPFAMWPLARESGGWLLRGSWLAVGVPQTLLTAFGQLRLGPVTCTVTDVAMRRASCADLAVGPAATAAHVTLNSPTYFAQNGARILVPHPRLIVGSWRRRWNASLPVGDDLVIDDDHWQEVHRALVLSEFGLHTEQRDTGHGKKQSGFAGTLTIRLARDAPRRRRPDTRRPSQIRGVQRHRCPKHPRLRRHHRNPPLN